MSRGIPLRADYASDDLRALARTTDDAKQARRLLALSLIYDGGVFLRLTTVARCCCGAATTK